MANYFSLPLAGAGTHNVENFRCYLSRLADIHGISVWQLVRHMHGWWARTYHYYTFPKYLLSTALFGPCAHGNDVARLLTIVETATGTTALRAATIQPLRDVLPPNATLIFKSKRAWCPACFIEQLQSVGFIYEPLLWALRNIDRCPEHQLELIDRCPNCGQAQTLYPATTNLAHCAQCGASLIPDPKQWKKARQPALGEGDLVELISLWAKEPTLTFSRNAYPRFIRLFESNWLNSRNKWIDLARARLICHSSHYGQPQLRTLLHIATIAGVSVSLLLEDPATASSIAMLPTRWPVKIPRAARPIYSSKYKRAIKRVLMRSLNVAVPFGHYGPSLHEIIEPWKVDAQTVLRWYPELVCKIRRRHILSKRLHDRANRKSMIYLLERRGLLKDYIAGHIRSQDSVVNILVDYTGARTSQARRLLKEVLSQRIQS